MGKFNKATTEHKAEALNYPEPPLPRRHWSVNTQLCCDDSVTADATNLEWAVLSAQRQIKGATGWYVWEQTNDDGRPLFDLYVC